MIRGRTRWNTAPDSASGTSSPMTITESVAEGQKKPCTPFGTHPSRARWSSACGPVPQSTFNTRPVVRNGLPRSSMTFDQLEELAFPTFSADKRSGFDVEYESPEATSPSASCSTSPTNFTNTPSEYSSLASQSARRILWQRLAMHSADLSCFQDMNDFVSLEPGSSMKDEEVALVEATDGTGGTGYQHFSWARRWLACRSS